MNMTSNCDVTNSEHQIQMTTVCHWMKPPPIKFSAYAAVCSLYVNQTNLIVKSSTKLRGPAENLGGPWPTPAPPLESPLNLSAKTAITDITGADNFSEKLADNFSEYAVTWLKCKTLSISGARLWSHSKWCCYAHKASRTRDCEYPMCREALEDKKLGNEKENYQL